MRINKFDSLYVNYVTSKKYFTKIHLLLELLKQDARNKKEQKNLFPDGN